MYHKKPCARKKFCSKTVIVSYNDVHLRQVRGGGYDPAPHACTYCLYRTVKVSRSRAMSLIKKLAAAAAISLCALAPATALAQKVLFLSTGQETNDKGAYKSSTENASNYFKEKVGDDNFRSGINALSSDGSINDDDLAWAEVVVIATGEKAITANNKKKLKTMMADSQKAYIIFSDGCDSSTSCKDNLDTFASIVGNATGMPLTIGDSKAGTKVGKLNSASAYGSHFSGLPTFNVERYREISGATVDNQLYHIKTDSSDSALAVFVPATQTGGACIFLAGEMTMWKDGFTKNAGSNDQSGKLLTLLDTVQPGSTACEADPPEPKPTVLYLSTAEWPNNGINNCTGYGGNNSQNNGGGAHFVFGRFSDSNDFTSGTRQSTGSLLALYRAVGDKLIARPGVLSTDAQIKKATYFNGTYQVQYPGEPGNGTLATFNATDRDVRKEKGDDCELNKSCTDWTDAMEQLDKLPKNSVVVVQSGYQLIDPGKAKTLLEKMSENEDLVFVLLLDTCDYCSYDGGKCQEAAEKNLTNLNYFMDGGGITDPAYTINSATGWELAYRHLSRSLHVTNMKSDLSAYGSEIDMLQLQGHTTGALECVPKQNVIFQSAAPTPPTEYTFTSNNPGYYCSSSAQKDDENCDRPNGGAYAGEWPQLNDSSAYGMLIPFWQNNKGQGGACIYLGVDNNIFDEGREYNRDGGCTTEENHQCGTSHRMNGTQHLDIAKMFASLPTGACTVRNEKTTSGVCDEENMKSTCYKCVLEETTDSGNAVDKTKDGDVAASLICPAKNWKAVCGDKMGCECAAGVIANDDNCCHCAHEIAKTSAGDLCCDINEKPVGDLGSQTCCAQKDTGNDPSDPTKQLCCGENSIATASDGTKTCCGTDTAPAIASDGNGQVCCTEANTGKDPAAPADPTKNLCCGKDNKDSTTGVCCGGDTPQPTPTAAGGKMCCKDKQVDDGTGKCADPCTGGKEYQAGVCVCPSDKPDDVGGTCYPACTGGKVHQDDGACVCPSDKPYEVDGKCTSVCPSSDRPICKEGQVVEGDCGCRCNMPYESRPYCEDGQLPAPYEDVGAKSGSKDAVYACCKPRPSTASPVPTAGWPALLGLGALLPLLARRQRRQSKRRDDA